MTQMRRLSLIETLRQALCLDSNSEREVLATGSLIEPQVALSA